MGAWDNVGVYRSANSVFRANLYIYVLCLLTIGGIKGASKEIHAYCSLKRHEDPGMSQIYDHILYLNRPLFKVKVNFFKL